MPNTGKTICVFVHYSTRNEVPYNVELYVNELARHFDEVLFLMNLRELKVVPKLAANIVLRFEKNEGYDFGMFYKFATSQNLDQYSEVALVNDSNLLVNGLGKVFSLGRSKEVDLWGLLDSKEKPWFSTHDDNYHLQSHFLVFNKMAIAHLLDYFNELETDAIFKEVDKKKLRKRVINDWEIGWSQFCLGKGLVLAAIFMASDNKGSNMAHKKPLELIKSGYPLFKKKVYLDSKWYHFSKKKKMKKELERTGEKLWDWERVFQELDGL